MQALHPAPDDAELVGVAAVRIAVTSIESISASASPRSASNSATTPWIVGRPCAVGLAGKFALTFAA
jgi:hypothetical protein